MLLTATHEQNCGRSLGSFGLNLKLQQPGNILKDFLTVHVIPIDLKEVVGVDLADLTDVQFVLETVVGNQFVFLVDDVAVEDFLGGFELLLAVVVHAGLVHVDYYEGVREDACLLHGQGLGAGFGKPR